MNDSIPDLKIERDDEGTFQLEQSAGIGESAWISLHPIHVRYLAELAGLVESSDIEAQRTIAALKRRLFLLRDRIERLADWLTNHADHEHADLVYETDYSRMTADLAAEFCADLETPK